MATLTTSLTLGTRGSPLALAQARSVAAALERVHGWSGGSVQLVVIKTSGDRIQDRPLADIGGKALWTKELDRALLGGEIDAAVHSMKDVESKRPPALTLAAMLPRADVRDRLIGAVTVAQLAERARVGTSSPRRAAQLLRMRPDLLVESLRGNVETRLAKIAAGEADATLLAAAGLERLGRYDVGSAIPVELMLPAPGQGAIGIECRSDDINTRALLGPISDQETMAAVLAERAFSRALGGTCHSPVGALALVEGDALWLRAELLSENGAEVVREDARLAIGSEESAAALAIAMLERSPPEIRRLFPGS